MKKTILTFGLLSGAFSAVMMLATVPFIDTLGDRGAIVGYTAIVLSFLFVYFGVRSYRDNVAGGAITFGRALQVGILIALISSLCYVLTWEFVYRTFLPDFMDQWAARSLEQMQASGATADAIQAQVNQMTRMKELYQNPLYRAALTFVEPFPIGLVMTVIASILLRRKR
jgi:hypothetical protein